VDCEFPKPTRTLDGVRRRVWRGWTRAFLSVRHRRRRIDRAGCNGSLRRECGRWERTRLTEEGLGLGAHFSKQAFLRERRDQRAIFAKDMRCAKAARPADRRAFVVQQQPSVNT